MASKTKTTVFTSLALALGLGLAGCSGDAPDTSNNEGQQSQQQEEQVDASGQLTAENFAERMNAAQLEAGSAHMTLEMSMGEMSTTGEARIKLGENVEDTAMHMSMDAGGMTMEMIMVGTDMYMNMGELTGNKFAKLPEDQLQEMDLESLQDQSNPAAQAETFEKALTDFTAEEGEEIDGVKTTKLTLVLDSRALLEESGEVDEEVLQMMGETVEYVMYVGEDDLPRRVVSTVAGSTTTVNYTKWGEPVEVTAPAEEDLTEMPF